MNEVVTLSEIERWIELKNKGEELSLNWEVLLVNYIQTKKNLAEIHRKRLESVEGDMDIAKEDWYLLTGERYDTK